MMEMAARHSLLSECTTRSDVPERPVFLPPPLGEDDIEAGKVQDAIEGTSQEIVCQQRRSFGYYHSLAANCVLSLVTVQLGLSAFETSADFLSSSPMLLKDILPGWAVASARIAGSIGVILISIAPATCFALLSFWRWVELPDSDTAIGDKLASTLTRTMRTCLGLLASLTVCGHYSARLCTLAYLTCAILIYAWCFLTGPLMKRIHYVVCLGVPMFLRYFSLLQWAKFTSLPLDQKNAAFSRLHAMYAPLVCNAAVQLGGVWVKAGQKLSSLPILPPEYLNELRKLQKDIPPRPVDSIKQVITSELKKPMEKIFTTFDDKPLGAASIGQVHRATLRNGQKVVVKIQYPELKDTLLVDLNLFAMIMRLKGQASIAAEMKTAFLDELDFGKEVHNLDRVHKNLHQFTDVQTPIPVHSLCTQNVLVMTIVDGVSLMDAAVRMIQTLAKIVGMGDMSVDDVMKRILEEPQIDDQEDSTAPSKEWRMLKSIAVALDMSLSEETKGRLIRAAISTGRTAANLGVALYNISAARFGAIRLEAMPAFDMNTLSTTIWRTFGHSFWIDGFLNGDPHPGNLLVDEMSGRLGLIDFGVCIEVSIETRVKFARLLLAMNDGDELQVAQAYAQLCFRSKRMTSSLIAKFAQFHYGNMSLSKSSLLELKKQIEDEGGDPDLGDCNMWITAIVFLRGTSMTLGTVNTHYPAVVWLEFAREFLRTYGSSYPVGSSIDLNLEHSSSGRTWIARNAVSRVTCASVYYDVEE